MIGQVRNRKTDIFNFFAATSHPINRRDQIGIRANNKSGIILIIYGPNDQVSGQLHIDAFFHISFKNNTIYPLRQ